MADGLAGGRAAPVIPVLPDGWQAEEIMCRGLIAAFLHVRPALASAPPTDAVSAGHGWPSPRTWEMAGRLMAAAGAAGASGDARSALIRGAVGDGAGVEFLAWLVEMDLPDPEQALADPASFKLPERGDRAYAALAAIASAVASNPTPERWAAGGRSSRRPPTGPWTWPRPRPGCWPGAGPTGRRCRPRSGSSPRCCGPRA